MTPEHLAEIKADLRNAVEIIKAGGEDPLIRNPRMLARNFHVGHHQTASAAMEELGYRVCRDHNITPQQLYGQNRARRFASARRDFCRRASKGTCAQRKDIAAYIRRSRAYVSNVLNAAV